MPKIRRKARKRKAARKARVYYPLPQPARSKPATALTTGWTERSQR